MIGKQKGISYKGQGKWELYNALNKYRRRRNKANKQAGLSRKRNR